MPKFRITLTSKATILNRTIHTQKISFKLRPKKRKLCFVGNAEPLSLTMISSQLITLRMIRKTPTLLTKLVELWEKRVDWGQICSESMRRNIEDFTKWRKGWRPVRENSISSEWCLLPDQQGVLNIFRSKSAIWSSNAEPRLIKMWPQSLSMGWRRKVFRMGWTLLTSKGLTLIRMRRTSDDECMMLLTYWLLLAFWGRMSERKLRIIDSIHRNWLFSSNTKLWMRKGIWQFKEFSKREMILKFFSNKFQEHIIWWKGTNKTEISISLKRNSSFLSFSLAFEDTMSSKSTLIILNLTSSLAGKQAVWEI